MDRIDGTDEGGLGDGCGRWDTSPSVGVIPCNDDAMLWLWGL